MNTHIGKKTIQPERITMLTDSKGNTDALSIIQEMYQKYRDSNLNLKNLEDFMSYVMEQNIEMNKDSQLFSPEEICEATINTNIIKKDETLTKYKTELEKKQELQKR